MTLVAYTDLSAYLGGVTWTTLQQNHITNTVLPGVQQELELYLNRPVEPLRVREARPVDEEGRVWLTVTPVWEVLSVDYTGQSSAVPPQYAPGALASYPSVTRVWDPAIKKMQGEPWLAALPSWIAITAFPFSSLYTNIPTYVVVDYVGGYNGYTDNALKLAILRVAAREVERLYDNSIGLRDGAGVPAGDSDRRDKGWTPDELRAFDRIRRRVVAT